jgi:hypothetical protein
MLPRKEIQDDGEEAEQIRRTKARLRVIQYYQQVTRNASLTCRFFGISRRANRPDATAVSAGGPNNGAARVAGIRGGHAGPTVWA